MVVVVSWKSLKQKANDIQVPDYDTCIECLVLCYQ